MNRRIRFFLLFALLALSFLRTTIAVADTGPKPTMDFEFVQGFAGDPVRIASGILYECQQTDCSDAQPLQQLGPQGFSCDPTSCHALAYGFSPYHRLEIQFSDGKTRRSNIFQTVGFSSSYKVTVGPDDMIVEAQFNPVNLAPDFGVPAILIALLGGCLICMVVILLVMIVLIKRRPSRA